MAPPSPVGYSMVQLFHLCTEEGLEEMWKVQRDAPPLQAACPPWGWPWAWTSHETAGITTLQEQGLGHLAVIPPKRVVHPVWMLTRRMWHVRHLWWELRWKESPAGAEGRGAGAVAVRSRRDSSGVSEKGHCADICQGGVDTATVTWKLTTQRGGLH